MTVFNYEKDANGIVTVTMDMSGPVNAMNTEYDAAMTSTVDRLENESGLAGVIIASAKKTFFAGGDLHEMLKWQKGMESQAYDYVMDNKELLRRLENLPVPVVAAINGAALGGGYEICLACNHRIAWDSRAVILGLPEVTLGLLPGAGGVVRLTNLLGLQKALPFLLEGKKASSAQALKVGLVDELVSSVEDLVPRAKAWILENGKNESACVQPWNVKGYKIPGGRASSPALAQLLMMAPVQLMQKTRGLLPAPEAILNVAVEATRLDYDAALRVETRSFIPLVTGDVAKNMISTFFQMNEVNGGKSRPKGVAPSTVKKLGVMGAGMMGQGIAYVSALAGIEVVLKDVSLESAEKGRAYSEKLLDKSVARGKIDTAKKEAVLALIKPSVDESDLQGCDLVIEAVFEKLELKNKITQTSESCLTDQGIWGTNTSTLPITRLAQASSRPDNFIGIHFFSPVDKMPLVELICGEKTSDETLAKAFDFTRQIRKTPIVVNDAVGFYTSRTICTGMQEASAMIAEGIHPVRVDNLGKALGWPVGPLTLHDEVSQKLMLDIVNTQIEMGLLRPEDDSTPEGTAVIKTMFHDHQRGGRYHGGGYYDYSEEGKVIYPKLLELYYKSNYEISDQDIKDRLLFRPVIETLKCLEEGVLRSVSDGNIGSLMGIGAPTWTGGYIQFVNTYGLEKFANRCEELAAAYGERFRAPTIVAEKIKQGKTF